MTGPAVADFRSEPRLSGTEVTITLTDGVDGPTPVTLQAWAKVPGEGSWTIPAARPLGRSGWEGPPRSGSTRIASFKTAGNAPAADSYLDWANQPSQTNSSSRRRRRGRSPNWSFGPPGPTPRSKSAAIWSLAARPSDCGAN